MAIREFPLWRLRPEDAARIIILEPLQPVEHHKFWRKREMRIRASKRSAPRQDDLKALAKAKPSKDGGMNSYWREAFEQHASEFPVFGVMVGPMLANGQFLSQLDKILHPYPVERPRDAFQGLYSRDAYEADMEYFEAARALLRENFILGQQGDGPYLDGLVFMKADNLLLAEEAHCKARLRATWAIMEQRRLAKAKPKADKPEVWHNIGRDEAVAYKFKQSGYTIRRLVKDWEVRMQ